MSDEIKEQNAIITGTMLGNEDHGIWTYYLNLDYDGAGQGAGGYVLDAPYHKDGKFQGRIGTAEGLQTLMRIVETVGAKSWEDLKGKHIRVRASFSKVHAIAHILKDNWLELEHAGDLPS